MMQGKLLSTHLCCKSVLSNHLNGRDTHVRQIKLYSRRPNPIPHQPFQFTSREFSTYASIRSETTSSCFDHAAANSRYGEAVQPRPIMLWLLICSNIQK
ncbi:hypothetical protein ACLB2K_053075 [Fragaria x ananassa]